MNQPIFTPIGTFPCQGLTDLPPEISFPVLKVSFVGNFSPSNWIPAGRLYRLAKLDGEKPTIVSSRVIWLQQPTLIGWNELSIPYTLKFEPSKLIGLTPLQIKLEGSNSQPPTGGGSTEISQEQIQDALGQMLVGLDGVAISYDDLLNRVVFSALFGNTPGTVCQGSDPRLGDRRLAALLSITNAEIAADAQIDWSKLSKSGAAPADIGAAPASHSHQASAIADFLEAVGDAINAIVQVQGSLSKSFDSGILTLTGSGAGAGAGAGSLAWEDAILNSSAWEALIS